MTSSAIETRSLTKRYGEIVAVDELSLRVPVGGVTGFVGANGAGKTTTIRMLLGLVRPTSGSARVLGESVTDPRRFLPNVGALVETPSFYPALSGKKNLEVLATLGKIDPSGIDALLERVGLGARGGSPYKTYSLGMKQRLGIAAALLPDPALLILDEPSNGLDPAGIREIRELLRELGRSKTVLVSSHLLSEVERVSEHLIVLQRGRLAYQGPIGELANGGDLEATILRMTEGASA